MDEYYHINDVCQYIGRSPFQTKTRCFAAGETDLSTAVLAHLIKEYEKNAEAKSVLRPVTADLILPVLTNKLKSHITSNNLSRRGDLRLVYFADKRISRHFCQHGSASRI